MSARRLLRSRRFQPSADSKTVAMEASQDALFEGPLMKVASRPAGWPASRSCRGKHGGQRCLAGNFTGRIGALGRWRARCRSGGKRNGTENRIERTAAAGVAFGAKIIRRPDNHSHFLQSRVLPMAALRPSSVVVQGRLTQGGLWRTCWVWPHSRSATQ